MATAGSPLAESTSAAQRHVTEQYTEMAGLYADLFIGEVAQQPVSMAMLATLAEHSVSTQAPVLDLGCGPGHVTEHLHELGAEAIGIERSPGMLEQATARFPQRNYCRGDLSNLGVATASASGIVSRFSTIHLPPSELPEVFAEYARVLAPGGLLVLGFFAADKPSEHGDDFDHKVATAYRVDVDAMAAMLTTAGFVETERHFTPEENRRSHAAMGATLS